jgi:O-antigen/teichoic acid export membrane protein
VLPLLTVSSAATSIGLNVLLIPRIGVMGAAWSTLAAYGLMAVLTFTVARTTYPVRIDLPRWALIVAVAAAAYGVSLLVPPPSQGLAMAILLKGLLVLGSAALIFAVVRAPLRRLARAAARSTDEIAGGAA